jgi:4-diphosphocytidyl-2-C-methyl-D-erythritol kinase
MSPDFPLWSSAYPEVTDLGGGAFALTAPAKINLGLRVIGKRPDGYHDLDTLFQEINWADSLEFHPSRDWSLEILGADLDPGESNLISKAARLLAAESRLPCRARLVLRKEIPLGGGLGGGSSNAAITLMGLSRLWGLDWPISRLHDLAAQLGSDCAFFLYGGLARGRGRGEALDLMDGGVRGELVLIVPPFGVSTAWVFQEGRFPLTGDAKSVILWFYSQLSQNAPVPREVNRNDLESIVLSRYDELGRIKQSLLDLGAEAAMLSGSGSTVFGIFEERSRALLAAQHFGPPFQVRVCHPVRRRPAP